MLQTQLIQISQKHISHFFCSSHYTHPYSWLPSFHWKILLEKTRLMNPTGSKFGGKLEVVNEQALAKNTLYHRKKLKFQWSPGLNQPIEVHLEKSVIWKITTLWGIEIAAYNIKFAMMRFLLASPKFWLRTQIWNILWKSIWKVLALSFKFDSTFGCPWTPVWSCWGACIKCVDVVRFQCGIHCDNFHLLRMMSLNSEHVPGWYPQQKPSESYPRTEGSFRRGTCL